jgi:hypothetical protein
MAEQTFEPGVKLTGEFLSIGPGKPWPVEAPTHHPVMVTLLVGERTARIEYRDADAVEWAVPGTPERGQPLTLKVYPQSPKGSTTIFWRGVGPGRGTD